MIIRPYDIAKDRDAVRRIWLEINWVEPERVEHVDTLMQACRTFVAELDGEAECAVTSAAGSIRYLDEDLPFAGCTSATTSRIARKQGLLRRVLAARLAADAAEGGLVAGLGMFDQGFYNYLGYGTGSYENWISFDPRTLRVSVTPRVAKRLTRDHADLIHASRRDRRRGHGSVIFDSLTVATQDLIWAEKGFGLGYCDGPNGELTHHIWCTTRSRERGPYKVEWMTFRTRDQFLELMALIKSLSDQVHLVEMREPPGIQLQDLLDRPFRHRSITEKSSFENSMGATGYWQMRILDLPGCLARTHLDCAQDARFNLHLTDPIARYLPDDASWRGCSGDYIIALGPESSALPGTDPGLPTLTASINAFSRLWLGVRAASDLAFTDDLAGPAPLLDQLDRTLRLPQPKPDWDF
jgi:predicted acetyltransferase